MAPDLRAIILRTLSRSLSCNASLTLSEPSIALQQEANVLGFKGPRKMRVLLAKVSWSGRSAFVAEILASR